jgi:hypothetical protein
MVQDIPLAEEAPKIAVYDEHEHETKDFVSKRTNSFHIDSEYFRKEKAKREDNLAYCRKFCLTQSMGILVTHLLHDQPQRPLQYCEKFMRTAEQFKPENRVPDPSLDNVEPRELMSRKWEAVDAPRAYIEKYKIPCLFTDLLTQLLDQKPEDPIPFCLSWLRWHKHTYEIGEDGKPLTSPKNADQ